MKKIFFILFLFAISFQYFNAFSSTYYLSSTNGNDLNSGTATDSAWQTLNRLNIQTIIAGDSILLKCGDTFFGTIILNASGNISSPIYFGKYSNGALPVVTGFKKLSNWTTIGNIYSTIDTNYVRSIWFNNKWMQPARYPNTGFLQTLFNGLNTAVFAPYLSQNIEYWDNSTAVVRSSGSRYEKKTVDTFDQGFLYFTNPLATTIPAFNGFFIENHLPSLDTLNEWYCDTATNQVLIIPPISVNINSADVEASVLNYGMKIISLSNYIVIDSISFLGQSIDAIQFSNLSTNITIKNCQFNKIKRHAINFIQQITFSQISNNQINDCGGDAIAGFSFNNCKIQFNKFFRTGINIGFGSDDYYNSKAININSGSSDTISDNYIDSTAYSGISIFGYLINIERNFISNSMLNLEDGGGIIINGYSFFYGNKIKDNFIINTESDVGGTHIMNPQSSGILLNYFCNNDTILNNTIINSDSYGIYVGQFNHHHFIKGNVLYNNQAGQVYITDGATANSTNQIELKNNILYSLNHNQKVVQLNAKSENFLPLNSDSNYYCNPYDYFPIYEEINLDTIIEKKVFSLSSWNQTTLQDSNSHVSNVEWKNQYATDTTGNDLISNGNFTNNYDDWSTIPLNNNSLLLDNLTMMDDGCIKFEITETDSTATAKIVSNQFPFQNNQFYEMSFSVSGSNESIVRSDITYQVSPYGSVGFNKYFPIETSRRDYNYFFQSTQYITPLALSFELHQPDSLVYFDNIHLFPVSVFKHDSTRMSVLLMNYSPNAVSVPLGADSVFYDLDGNIVTGSYTLNPYSSYVLVLDSPLHLVTVKEIQKQNSINVFPNPVQASNGKITVQLPDENKYDYEVYDLTGRKFLSGKFSGSTINAFSMKNASAGMYILSIHSDNKVWQQKIVVVN